MSELSALQSQIEKLQATCVALAAFVVEMPAADQIEMPRIKARIKADATLNEAQQNAAIDIARDIKHAIAARDGGAH